MKILVTGDTGTIGQPLMRALFGKYNGADDLIRGISKRHSISLGHARADVRNMRELVNSFGQLKPDYVIHLAAEFGRLNGDIYYDDLWSTNIIGLENIIRCCETFKTKLIFASSSEIYGDWNTGDNYIEERMADDMPLRHLNSYAISKWAGEQIIRNHSERYGLQAMTPRFFCIYGPGEYYHPYRSAICLFCFAALHGMPYKVYENSHRAFLYIDDFIPTLVKMIEGFEPGLACNIGGVEYCSVREMSDIILRLVGVTDKQLGIEYIPKDEHNVQNKRPDITIAREKFGHNPTTKLEDGIKNTIRWMCETYKSVKNKPAFLGGGDK